jgi:hypothetical protein
MATRMQQRRGTAAQWISTNSGNGPILEPGEIGYETDTNKFKIGDGTNHWLTLDYFIDANSTVNPAFGSSITFEGATADGFETTLQITDPTADRTITIPNVTGTVITTGNLSDITDIGIFTSTIVMEGSTADAHELTLSAGEPTADRTITFPDETGTVATQEYVDSEIGGAEVDQSTLAGNGISWNAGTSKFDVDTTTIQARVTDVTDTEIGYLNGVTSAIQTQLDAKSTESKTETLTNKTLTSPVVSGLTLSDGSIVLEGTTANEFETTLTVADPTGDRTVTFPDATGTVALTNNKLDAFAATSSSELQSVISDHNGSGTLVFADTPTLVTPNIGAATGTSLTLSGDLTINGTTTTINSTTLAVDDKNIILGDVDTPTDTTADGGGLTLKGATDKTFNWVDATDAWTSSEHINLASGKTLKYNGTDLVASQTSNSGKYLTTDGTSTSWGTVSGYSAPTLGSTSIASGATVTTIAGLTLSGATLSGTSTISGTGDFLVSGDTNVRIVPAGGSNAYVGTLSADNIITTAGNTQTLTNKTLTSPTMTAPTLGVASATKITSPIHASLDASGYEQDISLMNIMSAW